MGVLSSGPKWCICNIQIICHGIHNEFETTIKKVRSDNGSEFKNTRIDKLCDEFGIRHQFSAKYTPQSNGLVERKNRTLIDMARSMLSEYNVSHSFWAEAINTACYYSNRLYYHPMMEKTPHDLVHRLGRLLIQYILHLAGIYRNAFRCQHMP